MQKVKKRMDIEKIISAHAVLTKLLSQQGSFSKSVYWMGRNLDALDPISRRWNAQVRNIFEKYSEIVPKGKAISPDKYPQFRQELLEPGCKDISTLLEKYEIEVRGGKMVVGEKVQECQDAVDILAKDLAEEIEISVVEIDETLERALSTLTGNEIRAISFMFSFPEE